MNTNRTASFRFNTERGRKRTNITVADGAVGVAFFLLFSGIFNQGSLFFLSNNSFSQLFTLSYTALTLIAAYLSLRPGQPILDIWFLIFAAYLSTVSTISYFQLEAFAGKPIFSALVPLIAFISSYLIFSGKPNAASVAQYGIAAGAVFTSAVIFMELSGLTQPIGGSVSQTLRGAALFANPNAAATALGAALICLLPHTDGRPLRLLKTLTFCIAGLGIILTFSRAGFISLILIVLIGLTSTIFRRRWYSLVLAILVCCWGIIVLGNYALENFDLTPDQVTRIESFVGRSDAAADASLFGRQEIAIYALQLIENQPLGYGAGAAEPGSRLGLPIGPHNMLLAVCLEFGLIAGFVYLLCILRPFWGFVGNRQTGAVPLLFACWMILQVLTSHNLHNPVFTSAIGIVFAILATGRFRRIAAPGD